MTCPSICANGFSILTGNVDVHMGDRELQADQITHDHDSNTMNAVGAGALSQSDRDGTRRCRTLRDDGALFTHAQFQFLQQPGYGTAEQIALVA